jgi:protein-tyrosine kinase
MDRIKQALDRARAERTSSVEAPSAMEERERQTDAPIRYSQTKVVAADPNLLRENRVIFGSVDRKGLGAYKMLRTQVLQRMTARGWNALAITSPMAGDGKSLTAINLAISLARELHHTVLLVDMDLRNPSIHKYFGINPELSIGDFLSRNASLGDVLINPGVERLVILPGRESIENSSEMLASPAMGKLVQELKTRYPSRMVLFDLPPVLSADDALSFAPFVDAFLLVLRDGKSTKSAVTQAMEVMNGATILGTVLNCASDVEMSYY